MKNEMTRDQVRVRQALSNFPYTGLVRLPRPDGAFTDQQIADVLEELSAVVKLYSEKAEAAARELHDIKNDLAAVGRILALTKGVA